MQSKRGRLGSLGWAGVRKAPRAVKALKRTEGYSLTSTLVQYSLLPGRPQLTDEKMTGRRWSNAAFEASAYACKKFLLCPQECE